MSVLSASASCSPMSSLAHPNECKASHTISSATSRHQHSQHSQRSFQ